VSWLAPPLSDVVVDGVSPRLLVVWCFVRHMRTFSKGNANVRILSETGEEEGLSAEQVKEFAQWAWAGGR